ncbi:Ca-activated chloride channel family protein [Salinimicrobium catena]|uniref:Ca-activated chloride channel family protein n=1 Tax=Salinimicrobium catena TaxID=390640 RepID=A0A1H5J1G2_9FLAO|nr:VWA domain-containing protein [Salinimicrobium catena]SDK83081.1 Ca-activated chloride channel family protein [Salinimicrobium catena]SEE46355.1 Ca-activated chloride channel family protein [Salinimicrobium catena]
MFENIIFEDPHFFWFLLLLPVAIAWYIWKRNRQTAELKISSTRGFKANPGFLGRLRPVLFILRLLVLALVITALARPRTVDVSSRTSSTMGIDIAMAIDVSASMLARDLEPNRLEATKEVAGEFIKNRPGDRIGLVVYAGESFTKTPITSDKSIVLSSLEDVEYDNVLENGTAIGMGLATSVNRLKDSEAESKVIILLTDGMNNAGFIEPKIASELAVEFGIKVYTIGVGSNGTALSPVAIRPDGTFQYGRVPVEIDEDLLKEIAEDTGGKYFRATNNEKLEEIYEEIDALEKTEIEEFKFYNYEEKYRPLILLAGFFLIFEVLLRFTFFRSFI